MKSWREIDGWLTEEEGEILQRLVHSRNVLELGSLCGRSTVCIAQTARSVVSVDHHLGDEWTQALIGRRDTYSTFRRNLVECGAFNVLPLRGAIQSVGLSLPSLLFDVVFIDSGHSADDCERDSWLAGRVVRAGGTIVWHDWNFPTVQEGARRVFKDDVATSPTKTLAWIKIP
jgi:predicted O-methyltransferase YrrM